MEPIPGVQVTTLNDPICQLGERRLEIRIHAHDRNWHRGGGGIGKALHLEPRCDVPHVLRDARYPQRILRRCCGRGCQTILDVRRGAEPWCLKRDMARTETYAGLDPVFVPSVGQRSGEDQDRDTERHC